jgi:hypothetical protein
MSTNELLECWRDGSISEAELRDLTALLAQPDHHQDLLDDWLIESALPQMLGDATVARLRDAKLVPMPVATERARSFWRAPLIAAAACVALLLVGATFMLRRPAHPRDDLTHAFASAQDAISRMPPPPTSSLPAWMSPTASMLDEPRISQ